MSNDLWRTPTGVLSFVEQLAGAKIVFDCCADETNAVCEKWPADFLLPGSVTVNPCDGLLWCNPPYSNPLPFITRCAELNRKGYQIAMILNHDPSTAWFQKLVDTATIIMPVTSGRVWFLREDGTPGRGNNKPQVIVFFGGHDVPEVRTVYIKKELLI